MKKLTTKISKTKLEKARHAARYFGAEAVANDDGFNSYRDDIAIRYGYATWDAMPSDLKRDGLQHYTEGSPRRSRRSIRGWSGRAKTAITAMTAIASIAIAGSTHASSGCRLPRRNTRRHSWFPEIPAVRRTIEIGSSGPRDVSLDEIFHRETL